MHSLMNSPGHDILYYHPGYLSEIRNVLQRIPIHIERPILLSSTEEQDPDVDSYKIHYQGFLEKIKVLEPKECVTCKGTFLFQIVTRASINSDQFYLCTPCSEKWRYYKMEWFKQRPRIEINPETLEQVWREWQQHLVNLFLSATQNNNCLNSSI